MNEKEILSQAARINARKSQALQKQNPEKYFADRSKGGKARWSNVSEEDRKKFGSMLAESRKKVDK